MRIPALERGELKMTAVIHSETKILAPRGKLKRKLDKSETLAEAARHLLESLDGEGAAPPPRIIDEDLWRPAN